MCASPHHQNAGVCGWSLSAGTDWSPQQKTGSQLHSAVSVFLPSRLYSTCNHEDRNAGVHLPIKAPYITQCPNQSKICYTPASRDIIYHTLANKSKLCVTPANMSKIYDTLTNKRKNISHTNQYDQNISHTNQSEQNIFHTSQPEQNISHTKQ